MRFGSFETGLRLRADGVALRDDTDALTYSQLNRLALRFASTLRLYGVQPHDRVAFLGSKSVKMVASILGAIRVGATYVPLDAASPPARLAYIVDDLRPKAIVASQEMRDVVAQLPTGNSSLIALEDALCSEAGITADPAVTDGSPAYCMYTSGSTGRPKGVVISHGSVRSFFAAAHEHMEVNADSRCLNTSPLHFDVSVIDLFYPLSRGAEVTLYTGATVPNRYLMLLESMKISHFAAVGPTLGLMTQGTRFGRCDLSALKCIMTGAEKLNVQMIQKWLAAVPGVTILNGYGPTEATCVCTSYAIHQPEPARQDLYPIGLPWRNVHTLLVDDHNREIREYLTPGELLIGGPQVMLEYWSRPADTARATVTRNGIRFYRSGDICYRLPDGNLFFVGRRDDEVKISGFRINLSEIYSVLYRAASLQEVLVLPLELPSTRKVLAAILVPTNGIGGMPLHHLQTVLRNELPEYMVPEYVFELRGLPKLSSGKTDVKALSATLVAAIDGHIGEAHFVEQGDGSLSMCVPAVARDTQRA